ncbi:hypothetical protein [Corynebacterium propinquum]
MSALNKHQRKALRRLSRGQSIQRSMLDDLIIRECIDTSHYIQPPNLEGIAYPQSMIMWCDWQAKAARVNRPRLNDLGRRLLEGIQS